MIPETPTTKSEPTLSQNLYQLQTDIGPLTIQITSLPHYKWITITNTTRLLIDGSLQLCMQTPFNQNPTVIDIGADQNQAESENLCRRIGKELGCAVVLSLNLEVAMSLPDQRRVLGFLTDLFGKNKGNSTGGNTNNPVSQNVMVQEAQQIQQR